MRHTAQRSFASLFWVATVFAGAQLEANAQITPIGPFAGQHAEGFETQAPTGLTICAPSRVFASTADLCDSTGAAGTSVGIGVTSGCQFLPRSGGHLAYCQHPCEYTFDQPVNRFGGYFGQMSGQSTNGDGIAEFYDSTNTLLWTQPIIVPANCTWTWNGWETTGIQSFSKVKIISFVAHPPYDGGLMIFDDMQVDYGNACTQLSPYCTAKTNSAGCVPSISYNGLPSYSGPDNFNITAASVLNGKPGIMLWSLTPGAVPFFGGTLCVAAPITRTPGQNSGGTPAPAQDCTGTYSYHFTQSYMLAQLLPPGTRAYAQYWSRDPGSGPPHTASNIGLTNALTFMICP